MSRSEKSDWAKFATTVGLAPPAVRDRLRALAKTLPKLARNVIAKDRLLAAEP